jgi:hypothetical protein
MKAHELATWAANLGAPRRQFRRSTETGAQWEVTLPGTPRLSNIPQSVAVAGDWQIGPCVVNTYLSSWGKAVQCAVALR